jgi:hypothetical protein
MSRRNSIAARPPPSPPRASFSRPTWRSVAYLSLCTADRPLYTRCAKVFGGSVSETTMRPNPRPTSESHAPAASRKSFGPLSGSGEPMRGQCSHPSLPYSFPSSGIPEGTAPRRVKPDVPALGAPCPRGRIAGGSTIGLHTRAIEQYSWCSASRPCLVSQLYASRDDTEPPAVARRSPRVRSHCRCRNRGTEYVSKSGLKRMSGGTK